MDPKPSTSTGKRKRDVLTIEKKLEIIREIKKGSSASSLSVQFGVPRTTISDLKKNADDIIQFATRMESLDGRPKKRKTMRSAKNEALDDALYLWFAQKRSEGIPLSGPLVSEKALVFNQKFNGDPEFKASSGWLERFKNRHGIRELNIQGEKLSAISIESIDAYKTKFDQLTAGYTRDQIYNADETGLNYKALPTKTLASLSEKYAPGHKMQKQRVTVMVCANASGSHRMPLLMLGTAKKPRCFKGMNMNALPVTYRHQKKAWMDQKIFTDWFRNVFVPNVQSHLRSMSLPPNAILFLDNAPAHPEESLLKSDDGNIICHFLPANSTSLIQPMDQGVIESLKRRYRKKFLQQLLSGDEDRELLSYWKTYNMKDVMNNVADSWSEMQAETLSRAWNKLWPATDTFEITEVNDGLTTDIAALTSSAFNTENDETIEWLDCDNADIGYHLLTDDEIIEEFLEDETVDESDGEDYDGGESLSGSQSLTSSDYRKQAQEAIDYSHKLIEWYQQQEEADMITTMVLRKVRALAVKKTETAMVQTKVSDFFESQ